MKRSHLLVCGVATVCFGARVLVGCGSSSPSSESGQNAGSDASIMSAVDGGSPEAASAADSSRPLDGSQAQGDDGGDQGDGSTSSEGGAATTLCIAGHVYQLGDHDEFDRDTTLDVTNASPQSASAAQWSNEYCFGRLNTGLDGQDDSYYPSSATTAQWSAPPVAALADGGVEIRAYPVPSAHANDPVLCDRGSDGGPVSCRGYLAGFLSSAATSAHTEGYWEFKAEVPNGAGWWPALWLFNNSCAAGSSYDEVDVLEIFGDDFANQVQQTVILDNPNGTRLGGNEYVRVTTPTAATQMHTYAALITSQTVGFYIDNTSTSKSLARSASATAPYQVIMNLETCAPSGFCSKPAAGASASMLVEHFRYYAPTSQACSKDDVPDPLP